MPKQFVQRWLLDMMANGPYRDEREMKAEQQQIRENARAHVDQIWDKKAKEMAPPAPLPPPDWGTPPPVAPSFQESAVSTPGENSPVSTPADPGIGVVSRLADDYWADDPRPPGQIETIQ